MFGSCGVGVMFGFSTSDGWCVVFQISSFVICREWCFLSNSGISIQREWCDDVRR